MGNVVLMAVRHDSIEAFVSADFHEMLHRQMNEPDHPPKFYAGGEPWGRYGFDKFERNGALLSHYQDTEYNAGLLVNNQMLTNFSLIDAADVVPGTGIDGYITSFRRYCTDQKLRLLKSRKPLNRPALAGSKVSLFAIWTDTMSQLESNPNAQADIAHWVKHRELLSRTFSAYNGRFKWLTDLEADEAAIVQLYHGQFHVDVIPGYQVQVPNEVTTRTMEMLNDKDRPYFKAISYYERHLYAEFMAGFGYNIEEMAA